MRSLLAGLLAVALLSSFQSVHADGVSIDATAKPGWRLVWSDEFNGAGLDRTKWGVPGPPHATLADTDHYDSPRYLRVEDGVLKLIARPGKFGRYASAAIETQGLAAWKHGRFEARIKVSRGNGTNSAFWMLYKNPALPNEKWPLCGEIDILEQLGREPRRAYGTVHFQGREKVKYGGKVDAAEPLYMDFHVFALEWDETGFAWFLDGVKYHELRSLPVSDPKRPLYPFDRPFYIILSNPIGGDWPGPVKPFFTSWPKTMEVDWVRVYQR